ncbi:alternative ribosome rescue aminoacyl-tRNA hydrolase ArfB [Bythopirellula goksoeyrii]|uniref:Peptidyl-tRNA hydrolase ArfB n=1 Tax=Bythopirellula goksoeyrii TaxID=1400387 RepID=A0A5B9Q7W3_9BACT|nr:Peptidyl-tRNA hydrolase ArfB [Bythopirellula goksoeyrii]
MARSLIVNSRITIPATELAATFVRSSGPGGQNVNKVNSKVVLRWNISDSTALPPEVKSRFLQQFSSRISQSGDILISSDKYRNQARNLSDCCEKLRQLLQIALVSPRKRKNTRPTKASVERRLRSKREKSSRKQARQFKAGEE